MTKKLIVGLFNIVEGVLKTAWAIKTFGWKGYSNIRSISKRLHGM